MWICTSHECIGGDSTCAVSNGGVWCWGDNAWGQLGDGTRVHRFAPVQVSGLSTAASVAVASTVGCALLASGTVSCWGDNSAGQLGDGTTMPRSGVVAVPLSGVAEVAVGAMHVCARLTSGGVSCWGMNVNGQLGDGSTNTFRTTPALVPGITDATSLAIGHSHTCVARTSGAVSCWGVNASGQVGFVGSTTPRTTPYQVPCITTAVSVAVGTHFSCARLSTGGAVCWGVGSNGQLGTGGTSASATPVPWGAFADLVDFWASGYHSCARRMGGEVRCAGRNGDGDLGIGTRADVTSPVATWPGAQRVAPGELHVCALTGTQVSCAGRNRFGSIGDGNDPRLPARVVR